SPYIGASLSCAEVCGLAGRVVFLPPASQKETAMTEAKMGDVVRINYTGRLADGTQFDSSDGKSPLEFTIGLGQVIKGLESHVAGMEPGAKSTVTIPCDEAYGPHRPEAIQTLDRAKVPVGIDVRPGTQLQARTADGGMLPIT